MKLNVDQVCHVLFCCFFCFFYNRLLWCVVKSWIYWEILMRQRRLIFLEESCLQISSGSVCDAATVHCVYDVVHSWLCLLTALVPKGGNVILCLCRHLYLFIFNFFNFLFHCTVFMLLKLISCSENCKI